MHLHLFCPIQRVVIKQTWHEHVHPQPTQLGLCVPQVHTCCCLTAFMVRVTVDDVFDVVIMQKDRVRGHSEMNPCYSLQQSVHWMYCTSTTSFAGMEADTKAQSVSVTVQCMLITLQRLSSQNCHLDYESYSQAQEAISGSRPEAAQARGRSLLNLKLRDSEAGLLGRTLLTLILNKVFLAAMPVLKCLCDGCNIDCVLPCQQFDKSHWCQQVRL